MIKLNKFNKCLFALILAFFVALSTFSIFTVKADTTTDIYTFNSSNLFIPIKSYNENRNDNLTSSGIFNFQFRIDYNSTYGYYLDFAESSLNWIEYLPSQNRTLMYTYSNLEFSNFGILYSSNVIAYSDFQSVRDLKGTVNGNEGVWGKGLYFNIYPINNTSNDLTATMQIYTNATSGFVPNLTMVKFGSYLSDYLSLYGNRYWNYVEYTNYDGFVFRLSWYVGNSWCISQNDFSYAPMNSLLEERTYYFNTDFTQDVFYNNGYQVGKSEGFSEGKQEGIHEGFSNGFIEGKQVGYAEGVDSANDYTFIGLMSSLIDAPIQAIFGGPNGGGLLNFEFLGINLSGFYLSLFTIALVLLIVKIVMSGG